MFNDTSTWHAAEIQGCTSRTARRLARLMQQTLQERGVMLLPPQITIRGIVTEFRRSAFFPIACR
jgi:hypothetical protein